MDGHENGGGGEGEPCVSDHKGHFLRRDVFGCDDEVAFVFARGGVEDDDELAVLKGVDGIGDAVEVEIPRGSIGLHLRFCGAAGVVVCLLEEGIEKVMQTVGGREGEGLVLWGDIDVDVAELFSVLCSR